MQKCALRAHFCTLGAVRPHGTQVRPRSFWPESLGSRPPPVWAAAVLENFSKGSRGGTWRVTRGTWRHVTNAIVVPALWRIFWCRSRPGSASPIRSYWPKCLNTQTDWLTNSRPALQKAAGIRRGGNLHSENGLRPFSFISIFEWIMPYFDEEKTCQTRTRARKYKCLAYLFFGKLRYCI